MEESVGLAVRLERDWIKDGWNLLTTRVEESRARISRNGEWRSLLFGSGTEQARLAGGFIER